MAERPELASWPAWDHTDGFRALARYVSPAALAITDLHDAAPFDPALGVREAARAAAEHRYARLAQAGLRYCRAPIAPQLGTQVIRDPRWVVGQRSATCLDLVTLFSAMCLESQVAPLLAIDTAAGHAFVVIRLDRDVDLVDGAPIGATLHATETDVWSASDASELRTLVERGDLLALDLVEATAGAPFEQSVATGLSRLVDGIRLVDVVAAQRVSAPPIDPLPAPTDRRPGIRTFGVSINDGFRSYRVRDGALDDAAAGIIALVGPPGSGKSTLAIHAAGADRERPTWVLNASSKSSLIDELAEAERRERGIADEALNDANREGFAQAALERLRQAPRWNVVLDNANGHPNALAPYVPRASGEQRVLVTTTSNDWGDTASAVITLASLDDADLPHSLFAHVAPAVAHTLKQAIDGRPLHLESLVKLQARLDRDGTLLVDAAERAAHDAAACWDVSPTFSILWTALAVADRRGPSVVRALAICSLLPPDHLVRGVLLEEAGVGADDLELLGASGILDAGGHLSPGRIHRTYAEAARAWLTANDAELLREAAVTLAAGSAAHDLYERHGDPAVLQPLRTLVEQAVGAEHARLGDALHGLARLSETKGDTKASARLYERAEPLLPSDDVVRRAEAIHGRARLVNQQHAGDAGRVREAIAWTRQAQRMLTEAGELGRVPRTMALEGLLMQKLLRAAPDEAAKLAILDESRVLLERAHEERLRTLGRDDPELARSQYNLGGLHINLAKRDPVRAAEHFAKADQVYREVGETRRRIYGCEIHPHIAACDHGRAIVAYEHALRVAPGSLERDRLLSDATRFCIQGLDQRAQIAGTDDAPDVRKSTDLLARIAIARRSTPFVTVQEADDWYEQTRNEHRIARVEIATVPPLTSAIDPLEHIEAWLSSPALALLLESFDTALPDPARTLPDQLRDLHDRFSARWDRGGKERNQVAELALTPQQRRLTELLVGPLGLTADESVPGEADELQEYDAILVLGGLARACFTRPAAAAKLLAGRARAREVIGLSGYREVNDGERTLAAKLDAAALAIEPDLLELGLRRAFHLAAPASVERHDDGAEVRRLTDPAEAGPVVRVLAAPDREPGRRATTASQVEWLAANTQLLSPGARALLVTTHHYRAYQLADAIRTLGDPLGLELDAIGIWPEDYLDEPWAPTPNTYLREVRSMLRAYADLAEARLASSSS